MIMFLLQIRGDPNVFKPAILSMIAAQDLFVAVPRELACVFGFVHRIQTAERESVATIWMKDLDKLAIQAKVAAVRASEAVVSWGAWFATHASLLC